MKRFLAVISLTLLAACQSTPKLEDDARYVKLAKVVDKYEFTDAERKEGSGRRSGDSGVGLGMSIGLGSGGFGYGGLSLGVSSLLGNRDDNQPPKAAGGANRFTVHPLGSEQSIEVMSYGHYQVGDCVKVLLNHPNEYPRLYDLKPGESCE